MSVKLKAYVDKGCAWGYVVMCMGCAKRLKMTDIIEKPPARTYRQTCETCGKIGTLK